jgi:hypothetical protein
LRDVAYFKTVVLVDGIPTWPTDSSWRPIGCGNASTRRCVGPCSSTTLATRFDRQVRRAGAGAGIAGLALRELSARLAFSLRRRMERIFVSRMTTRLSASAPLDARECPSCRGLADAPDGLAASRAISHGS